MSHRRVGATQARWAAFRFGVVGQLLWTPLSRGALQSKVQALANQVWEHPISGEAVSYHPSTLLRWYYAALHAPEDAVAALRPRVRSDAGQHRPDFSPSLWDALAKLYAAHPSWSYQLHWDNLEALVNEDPSLGRMASYSTVRRHLVQQGWRRQRARRNDDRPAAQAARAQRGLKESRGWEMSHVHALWHTDFHDGSRPVLTPGGERLYPQLFGALDNRSRYGCHLQWYLGEGAKEFTHGLGQAMMKQGRPGGVMMDGGAAMKAQEVIQGLLDLGVDRVTIPEYTPEHNAIIEAFWRQIEDRLLPMLEGVENPTLSLLNEATQAWLQYEYNSSVHSGTHQTPIERVLAGPTQVRPAPTQEQLADAFRCKEERRLRRSDGTVAVKGVRFEVPSAYRHLERLVVRYARWDLRHVDLYDDARGVILTPLYPVDREANANGFRRPLAPVVHGPLHPKPVGMAPLLRQLVERQRQSGLPPAYLPQDESCTEEP